MHKGFRRNLLIVLGCALVLLVKAQEKTLTLERVLPGGKEFRSFAPNSLYGIRFVGNEYIYLDPQSNYQTIVAVDTKTLKKRTALTLGALSEDLQKFQEDLSLFRTLPMYNVLPGSEHLSFTFSKGIGIVDLASQKIIRYFEIAPAEIIDYQISPDQKHIAAKLQDGRFVNVPAKNNEAEAQTIVQDEEDKIVYAESVHQREFGIDGGIFWSPTSDKIAFYRMDQSMVEPYPLVDTHPHKARVRNIRYPMAGEASHHVTLGIYDLRTGQTIYLKTEGDPEHYLTNISWHPNGKTVYIAELNRAQNHLLLNSYDVATGEKLSTLFEERDEHYVEPQQPLIFTPKSQGKEFLWYSRRDGYFHYYRYNTAGKLLKDLRYKEGEVTQFLGFDASGKTIYYMATYDSPKQSRLYAQDIYSGKVTCLTQEKGVHHVQMHKEGAFFVDTYSSPTVPNIIALKDRKGNEKQRILEAANPDKGYLMPEIETGTLKAGDGKTDLYYRLVKPTHFSPDKKYPVIIYVYGGPHAQLVDDSWHNGAGGWDLYMAQEGYAVFTIDNRGSANRGKAFEQAIHRQVGTAEMEDQMQGVRYLQSLPWIDTDRIGVHGWSFGGFMTTNLMLTHSDIFKVGVAGGPVIDWSRYEIMYGERYNGSPHDNQEGYKNNNLTLRAKDLKGRLLLIHGAVDDVVVWQHAQEFVRATVDARTYPDCMFYPGHKHNVIGPDRVHLYTTITRYFKDFL